jgi:DNA/RNA endonuclease YhcR with UshA esterase domain
VAWVPRAALAALSDIEGLEGELVEARGRLRGYQDELQVTVRHPFALAVIEAP